MSNPRLIDLTLELRHETAMAYLVSDDGKSEHWLPKSQVELGSSVARGVFEFTMPEWLAEKKGLV